MALSLIEYQCKLKAFPNRHRGSAVVFGMRFVASSCKLLLQNWIDLKSDVLQKHHLCSR